MNRRELIRVALVAGLLVVLGLGTVLALKQVRLETGLRIRIETAAQTATNAQIRWRCKGEKEFPADRAVVVAVPAGKVTIKAFVPVKNPVIDIRIEALGVTLGLTEILGGKGLLRAMRYSDLEFPIPIVPGQFPRSS